MKLRGLIYFLIAVTTILLTSNLQSQTQNSDNLEARLNRAFMLSWQGKQNEAQKVFSEVLQEAPDRLNALVGLGYSLAWSEKYQDANKVFNKVLEISPGMLEAKKGLAYSAYWSGDAESAERHFSELIENSPRDPESHVALGEVHFAKGSYGAARQEFVRALRLDPRRGGAISGLEMLRNLPGRVELSLWVGNTAYSNDNRLGLRLFEFAYTPGRNLRFWGRYDNSLSLDNLGLIQASDGVPAYFLGSSLNWAQRFTTRFEVGRRDLPGGVSQTLMQLEQTVHFPNSLALKVGGYLGPREDNVTERLFYSGFNFAVSTGFRLEPTYYFSKTSSVDNSQHRFLLTGEMKFNSRFSLMPGLMIGRANLNGAKETVYGGHMMIALPVAGQTGYLLVRYEDPTADSFWVVALGTKLSLLRY